MIRSTLAMATAALALSGCALLASPDPVQLYRFGDAGPAINAAAAGEPVQVKMRAVTFPEASRGDRILGITGSEAAYIGGARWVSPAEDLYDASLEAAFSAQAQGVRLIGRRELTPTTRLLDIDINRFETRYAVAGAVPEVVVTARARLLRSPERTVVAERTFEVIQPAGENRVSAIVHAYEIATRDLNTQIVAWTEANAVGG